ncbi:MAG: histidine kinase dimerization/phosphoacceptor domain -containing protein, partial [Pseudomonadota bacterium]
CEGAGEIVGAFASLGLEEGAVAGILHAETAQPLARAPTLPDLHRQNASRSRLFLQLLPRAAAGTYTGASALEGVERLCAYRRLDGYPVVAIVGVARRAVLEAWSRRLMITAMIAVVLAALVMLLGRRVIGATAATARANDMLRQAVSDRNLLLSEVHHRVKNNLQIIQSLLTMESLGAPETSRSGYEDSLKRIQAMSMVHELLYQSGDFGAIRCREYLERLCGLLVGEQPGVTLTVDGDDAVLDIDRAVPFAMAVNEIVSNALKHGFAGGRGGCLAVRLRHRGGELTVTVADNGAGLPAGFEPGKTTSLGTRLLLGLADQLGGRVEFENAAGTTVRLTFPLD